MDTVLSKLKLYDNVIKRLERYNENIKQSFQMKYELTLEVDNLLKKAKNKITNIQSTYKKKKKMSTLDIFKIKNYGKLHLADIHIYTIVVVRSWGQQLQGARN